MKQRLFKLLNRNTALFTAGLLGVGHETLLTHAERPTLLILFAAMMGLPAFLTPSGEADEYNQLSKKRKNGKQESESGKPNQNEAHGGTGPEDS